MKKKTVVSCLIIIASIAVIVLSSSHYSNILKKDQNEVIPTLAIWINNEKSNKLPTKNENLRFDEEKSNCNNGVKINWSYLLWTANIDFSNYEIQNRERTYCNLYFKTRDVYTFDYTGDSQEFIVPKDGYYELELWGAGDGRYVSGGGAYVKGRILLQKNKKIFVYVGQAGQTCTPYDACDGLAYNGGASGGVFTASSLSRRGFGGGGATDIRLTSGNDIDFASLKSRILVAAGGSGYGVAAGGITGYSTEKAVSGSAVDGGAATQTSGGSSSGSAQKGMFGRGGNGYITYPMNPNNNGAGGGSGGYYGGGGGLGGTPVNDNFNNTGSGGSGSSFISGHNGCDAIKEESTESNIIHTGQPNHYSGYIFTDTKMIDGMGYAWTNTKQSQEQMPNSSGGYYDLGIGHTGNGYARITYLGK